MICGMKGTKIQRIPIKWKNNTFHRFYPSIGLWEWLQREVPISVFGITPDDHTLTGFSDLHKTSAFMLMPM
jgi:hypothetical protein